MDALNGVLADLVEADSECRYATVRREPLENLIADWARRGDRIAMFSALMARARHELLLAWRVQQAGSQSTNLPNSSQDAVLRALSRGITESASAIAHHRHAIRKEFTARLKKMLRSTAADVGAHATQALLQGETELAERLESERSTVQIVVASIDAALSQVLQEELVAAGQGHNQDEGFSPAV
jgi:hypothetical protein